MLKITTQATDNITTTTELVTSSETVPVVIAIVIVVIVVISAIVYFVQRCIKKRSHNNKSSQIIKDEEEDMEKNLLENKVTDSYPLTQLASVHEEPIIIAEKTGGLQSGAREKPKRLHAPRKWFDSTALKYMDQSTENIAAV